MISSEAEEKETKNSNIYELHYVTVKKNKIPQVTITVPYNCDQEYLKRFTLVILYQIIKDTIEPDSEYSPYENLFHHLLS